MVRDVKGVDDNPFDFETVKKNIFEAERQKAVEFQNICHHSIQILVS